MQMVYQHIRECDNIVIASPIYYSELTGKLLDLASRFQPFYYARVIRNEDPGISPKKGGIILTGGGDGSANRASVTAKILLRQLNVKSIFPTICSHNTNVIPAGRDEVAVDGVTGLATFLNSRAL